MSLDIISRAGWGAQHEDGGGAARVPATEWWLHHSATIAPDLTWVDANGDHVDDDERAAMQLLERIGEQRFGRGISYTWCVMPSARVYVGHTMGRLGAHTAGHNTPGRAICLVGDYERNVPTDGQLTAAAEIMVVEHRAGRASTHHLTGGHRDLRATACPGEHAYRLIGEINRRAGVLWAGGGPAPAAPRPTTPPTSSTPTSTRPTLRRGSRGPAVRDLQRVLAAWYPKLRLVVDGDFGPATDRAVRHLQERADIAVDGIAGPQTYRALRM